jgi:hypothetical protein
MTLDQYKARFLAARQSLEWRGEAHRHLVAAERDELNYIIDQLDLIKSDPGLSITDVQDVAHQMNAQCIEDAEQRVNDRLCSST